MPTDREQRMAVVLPRVRKRFDAAVEAAAQWRGLFDTFAAVSPVEGGVVAGPIRVRGVSAEAVDVENLPAGVSARQFEAKAIGAVTVRTEQVVEDTTLDGLGDGSTVDLDAWASSAAKAGASVLFGCASKSFDEKRLLTKPIGELAAAVTEARDALGRLALDLVVDEQLVTKQLSSEVREAVEEELQGGVIIPLAGGPPNAGWLVPHGGHEIALEVVHRPNVRWDIGGDRGVCLIAHEEFIVLPRRNLGVCRLRLTGPRRGRRAAGAGD
jgi:hypothetical protein